MGRHEPESSVMQCWRRMIDDGAQLTVVTGAGISAESGIPTFRGPEGYWTMGSKVYQPQEMASAEMFLHAPYEVWRWYCYRRTVCHGAQPNKGHVALVDLEKRLGSRFTLITQNVDGLHVRAGQSLERIFQIHGNIDYMRCTEPCCDLLFPLPEALPVTPISRNFPDSLLAEQLRCPACGKLARPHILWFDECYDEMLYHFESCLDVAAKTDLLLVIGSSGSTTLPRYVLQMVVNRGGYVIDINKEKDCFAEVAMRNDGSFLSGKAGDILPLLVAALS